MIQALLSWTGSLTLDSKQHWKILVTKTLAWVWCQKESHPPSDKTGKTTLDYVSCASESFKRIQKGSSYYRRILLIQKPRGTTTYKSKMKKRLGVNLRQDYVNRATTMLNRGMILPENSDIDILHRFFLGKTQPGEELRTWKKNKDWDSYCIQCCKVVSTMQHIFNCEKTLDYLDKINMNVGVQRGYGLQSHHK